MIEPQVPGKTLTPGKDFLQPRNVWRRAGTTSQPAPDRNIFWQLLTVPPEVLLRHSFGQRWLTLANFFGGCCILALFASLEWLISWFFTTPAAHYVQGSLVELFDLFDGFLPYDPGRLLMPWILGAYVVRSAYHFFRILWRKRANQPRHSFDDGTSLLEPLARVLMRLINLLSWPFLWFGTWLMPHGEYKGRASVPRLLDNVTAFTTKMLEPLLLLILAFYAPGTLSAWLLLSAIAMSLHARRISSFRRNKYLDFRDAMTEAEVLQFRPNKGQLAKHTRRWQKPKFKTKQKQQAPASEPTGSYPPDLAQIIEDLQREGV